MNKIYKPKRSSARFARIGSCERHLTTNRWLTFTLLLSFSFIFSQGLFAQQNSFIYLHQKSIDESTSPDVTYTITGPNGYSKTITLNDLPDHIQVAPTGDGTGTGGISMDNQGNLYAIGVVGNDRSVYYNAAGTSEWVKTDYDNANGIVGGSSTSSTLSFFYIHNNSVNFVENLSIGATSGTETTIFSTSSGTNNNNRAVDIDWVSGGQGTKGELYVLRNNNSGRVYRYTYSGSSWSSGSGTTIKTSTSNAKRIAVSKDRTYLYYGSSGNVNRFTIGSGTGTNATNIGRPTLPEDVGSSKVIHGIAINGNGEIFVSYGSDIYQYFPGSGTWGAAEEKSYAFGGVIAAGPGSLLLATVPYGAAAANTSYANIFVRAKSASEIWYIDDIRLRTTALSNSVLLPVPAGKYAITISSLPTNFDVSGINLYDPTNNSSKDVNAHSATLEVAAGETVNTEFMIWNEQSTSFDANATYIYNEDFGQGNTVSGGGDPLVGQTSYHFKREVSADNGNQNASDGYYQVVSEGKHFASWGSGVTSDHTGNANGRFMAVNAAYNREEFFRHKITGAEAGTYSFSAWLSNLSPTTPNINPNVTFKIVDAVDGTELGSTNTGEMGKDDDWHNYTFNFTMNSDRDIVISIVNNTIGGDGNDLGLDDIQLKFLEAQEIEFQYTTDVSCSRNSGAIHVTNPLGSNYEYALDENNYQSSPDFTGLMPGTYNVRVRKVGQTDTEINQVVVIQNPDCAVINNDINQTPSNVPVIGNVSTNDIGFDKITGITQNGTALLFNGTTPNDVYGVDKDGNTNVLAGTLTIDNQGAYKFVPENDFEGLVDPIDYIADIVNNGQQVSAKALLSIIVTAHLDENVNHLPLAQNDNGTTIEGVVLNGGSVLSNDSDPSPFGDPASLSLVSAAQGSTNVVGVNQQVSGVDKDGNTTNNAGTLNINSSDGSYTFTPATGFTGIVDPIHYTMIDALGAQGEADLFIKVIPGGNTNFTFAQDDANSGRSGDTQSGNLLDNDTDPENDAQRVTSFSYLDVSGTIQNPSIPNGGSITRDVYFNADGSLTKAGSLKISSNGNYEFTSENTFVGTVPVIYNIVDGNADPVVDRATLYLTALEVFKTLPVTLTDFNAQINKGTVDLTWTTTLEQNNAGFDVEHSTDGRSWQVIGHVNSKAAGGNSNSELSYQLTDNNPADGVNYYRLHQTDLDGRSTLSEIRTVEFKNTAAIQIYPNPVRTTAVIKGLSGNETLRVYDGQGRIVKDVKAGGAQETINFSSLAQGTYRVQVVAVDGKLVKTLSVIKTRIK